MNVPVQTVAPQGQPESVSQGRLFQRLRWQILRNARLQLFGNSKVRFFTMIACSFVVWLAVFAVGWWGFTLVWEKIPFSGGLIELLFDAMFFTLGGMLVFSTGLILYASLFTGAETRFLLTTPARADQIFAVKFQGAVAYSSWAFVILGGPILIAYGIVYSAPFYFYILMPIFFVGFTLIPGGLGAALALAIVNFFPHRRKQALLGLLAILCAVLGWWIYKFLATARGGMQQNDREALTRLFDMFSLAKSELSPSRWISHGLIELASGNIKGALMPLALIWSHGLMLYVGVTYAAKHLYRRGFNRMATGGDLRRRYGSSWLDRWMNAMVSYLDRPTRILIIKDFRTFRREPAQVGQLGIFAGLLLLCVLNSRQFFHADIPVTYQHGLSFLNMSATGLLMCAYLGRFIYPLVSLEGRKFWILGLLPLRREQILRGKFVFAVTMTILLAGGMVLLSDVVLGMPWFAILIHQFTVLLLAFGLSGLSVGLSAWLPNFRETDPSKIVLGFGGTMNMILSLVYLIFLIGTVSGPYHLSMATEALIQRLGGPPLWIYAGIPVGILLTVIAVWVPMRIGAKKLRTMEF